MYKYILLFSLILVFYIYWDVFIKEIEKYPAVHNYYIIIHNMVSAAQSKVTAAEKKTPRNPREKLLTPQQLKVTTLSSL